MSDLAINTPLRLLIFAVVVIVSLLLILEFSGVFDSIIDETTCEASFAISAFSKAASGPFRKGFDPKCKTNRITITMDDEELADPNVQKKPLNKFYFTTIAQSRFSKNYDNAYDLVSDWNADFAAYPSFQYSYIDDCNDDPDCVQQRYNLDYLFAEEMQSCWTKVGQGNLDLFDNWFEFIDCHDAEGIQACESPWEAISFLADRDGEVNAIGEFCVLCSRIKFEPQVTQAHPGEYDSINDWMRFHPIRVGTNESYFEYIMSDYQQLSMFNRPWHSFSTEEPMAVLYTRANFHAGVDFAYRGYWFLQEILQYLNVLQGEGEDIYAANVVHIVPYQDIPQYCDYLVGDFT